MTANPLSPIPPLGPTTGMAPAPGWGRFKPIDPLRVLRQHLWLMVVLGFVGLVSGGVTWYALREYAPQYTSQAQLQVVPANPNVWGPLGNEMSQFHMDALSAAIQNEIAHLMSEETLRLALEQPIVRETAWFESFRGPDGVVDARAALESLQRECLEVVPRRGSTLMTLSMTTPTREDAPRLLQAVIDVYLQKLRLQTQSDSTELRQVYVQERQRAQAEIEALETQIRDFTINEDLANFDAARAEHERLTQQRVELELALDQATKAHESLKAAQQAGIVEPTADVMFEIEQMDPVASRDERLRSLREERERLLARFGPQHYQITDIDRMIEAVEAEKDRTIERLLRERQAAQVEQAAQQVEMLKAQIAALQPKLKQATARMNDFAARRTRLEQLQEMLDEARRQYENADDALAQVRLQTSRPDAVRVRQQVAPTTPKMTFPRLAIVVPGITLLVLAAGTGLLFLREVLDQRVKCPTDVKLLPEAELLGVLPDASEDPNGPRKLERVVDRDPTGLLAESFRQVRTAVLTKMDRRGYRTLVVAAAQPDSGTSVIAQNLATSMAHNGRNVLLVDANLRRPAQHKLMDVRESPGLSDYLQGRVEVKDVIVPLEGRFLSLMPAGHTDNALPELLEAPRFRTLLSQLESSYDLIIIDAPPALLTTDCQLLAKHVDAMALVVRAGRDKRGMIERMIRQLDGQRADILGLMLNGVRSSAGGYFRQSYRDFYRYRTNGAATNGAATRHRGGVAAREADGRPASLSSTDTGAEPGDER